MYTYIITLLYIEKKSYLLASKVLFLRKTPMPEAETCEDTASSSLRTKRQALATRLDVPI